MLLAAWMGGEFVGEHVYVSAEHLKPSQHC